VVGPEIALGTARQERRCAALQLASSDMAAKVCGVNADDKAWGQDSGALD
jgi:hypothetical protein